MKTISQMWEYHFQFFPLTELNFVGVRSKHLRIFFGSLRQSSKIFSKRRESSSGFWTNFEEPSEIFGKRSEIFGKSPKATQCIVRILSNKKKYTYGRLETQNFFPLVKKHFNTGREIPYLCAVLQYPLFTYPVTDESLYHAPRIW